LKIIQFPTIPAQRTETGKMAIEMIGDFTGKRRIVVWRDVSNTEITLSALNFDDGLFSILKVPYARRTVSLVQLDVMKCK
jgi:hypothetical protein